MSNTDITCSTKLVLTFRSIGPIIVGLAADRYGRKRRSSPSSPTTSSLTIIQLVITVPNDVSPLHRSRANKLSPYRQADPMAPTTRVVP